MNIKTETPPFGKSPARNYRIVPCHPFPGFYGKSTVNHHTITYHIGVNIERLYNLLTEQIHAGLCFDAKETGDCACDTKREKAIDLAGQFISRLPALREVLATDVEAALQRRPGCRVLRRNHQLLPYHQGVEQLPYRP